MKSLWSAALLVWVGCILAVTLSPVQPTDGGWVVSALAWLYDRGLPPWVSYDVVEVGANVLLFVPLGALLALRLTRRSAPDRPSRAAPGLVILWSAVLGLSLSLSVELVQAILLPARVAAASDLVANALGALFGAAVVALSTAVRGRRRLG